MDTACSLFVIRALEDPARARRLLEEELVGPSLLRTVAELSAVYNSSENAGPLPDELLARILEGGLTTLPEQEFRSLVSSPHWLLPLQKAILLEGGPYWDGVLERTWTEPTATKPAPPRSFPFAWLGAVAAAALFFAAGMWVKGIQNDSLVTKNRQLREQLDALAEQRGEAPPRVTPSDLPEDVPADLPDSLPRDLPL